MPAPTTTGPSSLRADWADMDGLQVRDPRGMRYTLGEAVGKGGEATVYQVAGKPRWLAKMYTRPTVEREAKLAWMIAHPPEDPSAALGHTSIAWPVQLLYADSGFAGYLMPRIQDSVAVLNVFHPRLRLQTFQGFTQRHLHNTAYNIAAALGAIHARGYVVGDLNESNVLVARSTLVTLIDTDSFQVRTDLPGGGSRLHRCEVGKPEYLPPELQGANLKTVERTLEHDRFALSVLLFQLLMNGNHPYRARWTGPGEKPPLPERIQKGLFPYRDPPPEGIQPVASLAELPPTLANLFRRSFILGHVAPDLRPPAGEWERALSESVRTLVACRRGHYYSPHLDACPECGRPAPVPRRPAPAKPAPEPPPPRPQPGPPAFPPGSASALPVIPTVSGGSPVQPAFPTVTMRSFSLPPTIRTRLRAWMRRNRPQTLVLQPAAWAAVGALLGALVGAQFSALSVGRLIGIIGGLAGGALAGDLIEKKLGLQTVFGVSGFFAGLLAWSAWGMPGGTMGGLTAGAAGGLLGYLVGRYGRFAEWALVWAVCGALGGGILGQWAAQATPVNWLAAGLSGGLTGLMTGTMYYLWRKYG